MHTTPAAMDAHDALTQGLVFVGVTLASTMLGFLFLTGVIAMVGWIRKVDAEADQIAAEEDAEDEAFDSDCLPERI
jgi:hypothetical protein